MGSSRRTRIGNTFVIELNVGDARTGETGTGGATETSTERIEVEPLPLPPVDLLRCRHCGFPLEPDGIEPVRWTRTTRLPSPGRPVGPS